MKNNRRTIFALVMACVMLISVAGVAMAAAPVVDDADQTTDTTATGTEIVDGSTVSYNAETNSTLKFRADSDNYSVKLLQDGTELQTFDNASDETTFVETGGTSGDKYFNFTIADDETGYSGIVADPGENVTLTYRLINDSTMDNPDMTNVTVYWVNHENKSFQRYNAADVDTADRGTIAGILNFVNVFSDNDSVSPAKAEKSVAVNGADTEFVEFYVSSSDATDALVETYDAAGDNGLTWMGMANVNGDAVPVVQAGEDGPDWLDTGNETYVSVSSDGEEVVAHNAGDVITSGTSDVTISAIGHENAGFWRSRAIASNYGASFYGALQEGLDAGVDVNMTPDFGS